MSEKKEKPNNEENKNLSISIFNTKEEAPKNNEIKKLLIGNKRERAKTEEEEQYEEQNKICKYCKSIDASDIIELNESCLSQKITNFFSKNIKDENFSKILKENLKKILNNEIKNKNIICSKCFLNNFISGGIEKLFLEKKGDNNIMEKDKFLGDNDQKKNLKQIVDIYSINFNLAIKSLKELKNKYSKTIKSTNEVFENTAIRVMLSNNKEIFQDLKKKMDDCKENLKEIEENFDTVINDLTKKEGSKKFFIEGVFSNNIISKNHLLEALKGVENEIEFSIIDINNGGPKLMNIRNEKNEESPEVAFYNLDKKKAKEICDKNNNCSNNKNNIQSNNNINSNILLNPQNQKMQDIIEQSLNNNNIDKNEILKNNPLLSPCPDSPFINPGLGFYPNLGPQISRLPNNILINNFIPPPSLNPQLIGQINNNQINSIIPNNNNNSNNTNNNNNSINNNNINENNKNINNLNNLNLNNMNNLQFPGINCYFPKSNLPFGVESLKEFDNNFYKNLMNSNQNSIINSLYPQISQNPFLLSPIPFSNFNTNPSSSVLSPILGSNLTSPNPSSLYNNIPNLQGNNDISNLSLPININNNLEQNKLNQLNFINRERNAININQNSNKSTNSNINNNNSKLLELFNNVARERILKNTSLNNENKNLNLKNNNSINNNNSQLEMNSNSEQKNLQTTNIDFLDIKAAPINSIENNTNIINKELNEANDYYNISTLPNNNINNLNMNNLDDKINNTINNEKGHIKKDN